MSMIEVLGSMAIVALVTAVAIPRFRSNTYDLWQTHTMLMADLRQARAYALTRGDHFRITINNSGRYELRRFRDDDNDGVWAGDNAPLRVRTLPTGVTITSSGGAQFEFNTRGLMINPNNAAVLTLRDSRTNYDRTVRVYPSGQVAPL